MAASKAFAVAELLLGILVVLVSLLWCYVIPSWSLTSNWDLILPILDNSRTWRNNCNCSSGGIGKKLNPSAKFFFFLFYVFFQLVLKLLRR